MPISLIFRRPTVALAVINVLVFQPVYAQDDESNIDEFDAFVIEEVVVTAQKRMQTAQDVGISMAAFTEKNIEELSVERTWDVAAQIPNLDIKNAFGNTNPVITIRGIGINDVNTNNNPSAGVYVDQVYLGSSAMLGFALFDIARVEVLKGPQGTLYGRNTTSGAISFFTNKPSEFFKAKVTSKAGNYNMRELEGFVSGPLADALQGRLAVFGKTQEGHYDNPVIGDDEYGDTELWASRATLAYVPDEDTLVHLSIHAGQDNSESWPYAQLDVATGKQTDGDDDPFTVNADDAFDIDVENFGIVVTYEKSMGDYEFASITAFEEVERQQGRDNDSGSTTSAPRTSTKINEMFDDEIRQLTQELRLTWSGEQSDWILGAFVSREEVRADKSGYIELANSIKNSGITTYEQTGESASIFSHSEWYLNDLWSLILGLRYTWEQKDFDVRAGYLSPPEGSPVIFEFETVDETAFNQGDVFFNGGDDFSDTDGSGVIGLNFRPTYGVLAYASLAKGFKSGGFDGSTIRHEDQIPPFDSETVIAYEAGLKATFLDERLRWNTAVFRYDYQDMQLNTTQESGATVLTNVGKAEITGVDMDFWLRAVQGLDLKLGIGYVDGEIRKFEAREETDDFKGNTVPNAPQWTGNGLVRYEWRVTANHIMAALLDVSYQTSTFRDVDNNTLRETNEYLLVNARLSFGSANDIWSAALWGRNLTNKEYLTHTELKDSLGYVTHMYGMPKTFGLSFNYWWE